MSLPMPHDPAGRVVGDDGEITLALARQFADEAVGRADTHEPADQ
jgi:hypothetical protein